MTAGVREDVSGRAVGGAPGGAGLRRSSGASSPTSGQLRGRAARRGGPARARRDHRRHRPDAARRDAPGDPARSSTTRSRASPRRCAPRAAPSTPLADLSRGVVGVRGRTLIVNLPGSPQGRAGVAGGDRAGPRPRPRDARRPVRPMHGRRRPDLTVRDVRARPGLPARLPDLLGRVRALRCSSSRAACGSSPRSTRARRSRRPTSASGRGALVRYAFLQTKMFRWTAGRRRALRRLPGLHDPARSATPTSSPAGSCRRSSSWPLDGRPLDARGRAAERHRASASWLRLVYLFARRLVVAAGPADPGPDRAADPDDDRARRLDRVLRAGLRGGRLRRRPGGVRHQRAGHPAARRSAPSVTEAAFAVLWWAHIVVLAAFLLFIPTNKHFHVDTSFVNI